MCYACMLATVCLIVTCPPLTDPDNGTIVCLLEDDGVSFYEDTCSFTCNTGYKLTGSDTRTCQSDGSWSGSVTICNQMEGTDFLFNHAYSNPCKLIKLDVISSHFNIL